MSAQIQDYLQTQGLNQLDLDNIKVAKLTAEAVFNTAQAEVEESVLKHQAVEEILADTPECRRNLKQMFLVLDSVYSRHRMQSAVLYARVAPQQQLIRLVQQGAPIEQILMLDEASGERYLASRSGQTGWLNIVEVEKWLKNEDLHGEHNQRAPWQVSLPLSNENGQIFGVLHLENQQALSDETLEDYLGLVFALMPVLQEMFPSPEANESA